MTFSWCFVHQNHITVNKFMDQIVDSFIWAFKHTDGTDNIEASDSRLLGDFTIADNTHTSISYVHIQSEKTVMCQPLSQYHNTAVHKLGISKMKWKMETGRTKLYSRTSFIPFHLFGSHDAICPSNLPFWSSPSRGVRGSSSVSST